MAEPLQCKQCHGPITSNDSRCFYCGTPVNGDNAEQADAPPADTVAATTDATAAETPAAPVEANTSPAVESEAAPPAESLAAQAVAPVETVAEPAVNTEATVSTPVAAETAPPADSLAAQVVAPVEPVAEPAVNTETPASTPVAAETAPPAESLAAQAVTPAEPVTVPAENTVASANTPVQTETAIPIEPETVTPQYAASSADSSAQVSFASQATSTLQAPASTTYGSFVADSSVIQSPAAPPQSETVEPPMVNDIEALSMETPRSTYKPVFEVAEDYEQQALEFESLLLEDENAIMPDAMPEQGMPAAFYSATPQAAEQGEAEPVQEYKPISYNSLFDDPEPVSNSSSNSGSTLSMASGAVAANKSNRYDSRNKKGSRLKAPPPNKAPEPVKAAAPKKESAPYYIMLPLICTVFSVLMLLITIALFYALNSPYGLLIVFPVWPLGLTFFSILTFLSPLKYLAGKRSAKFFITLNLAFNLIMCVCALLIIFMSVPLDITIWSLGWISAGFILNLAVFFLGRKPAY